MKKPSTRKIEAEKKPAGERQQKTVKQPQNPAWQSLFTKRLPHRVGQPLSSGGGGDGCCMVEQ